MKGKNVTKKLSKKVSKKERKKDMQVIRLDSKKKVSKKES